jgi:protein-tyrosine kinase
MSRRSGKAAAAIDTTDAALVLTDEAGTPVLAVPHELAEGVRAMVARLQMEPSGIPNIVGVISAVSGEGTTTVARALSLVLTNDLGLRVCLLDVNFWSPSDWPDEAEARSGIAEVIAAGASLDVVAVRTGAAGLTFLPAGVTAQAERPLLANSGDLDTAIAELARTHDHVVLDLPAVHSTSSALMLAERANGIVIVIQQGVTSEGQIGDALEQLRGVTVIGSILNRAKSRLPAFLVRRLAPYN